MTSLLLADQPQGMWDLAIPWWELTARAVLVYLFLLVLLRLTGKRQVGQLAPFDLVLLLILSNAVQNAMNGGDNSFTAGAILATALVVFNGLVGYATFRSKTLEGLVEGRPKVLIHNGRLYESVLRGQRLTHHELMAALRRGGCTAWSRSTSRFWKTTARSASCRGWTIRREGDLCRMTQRCSLFTLPDIPSPSASEDSGNLAGSGSDSKSVKYGWTELLLIRNSRGFHRGDAIPAMHPPGSGAR